MMKRAAHQAADFGARVSAQGGKRLPRVQRSPSKRGEQRGDGSEVPFERCGHEASCRRVQDRREAHPAVRSLTWT